MFVYLVRHGEALSEQEDPARPLSEPGKNNIVRISNLLAQRIRPFPDHIYHSPKTRASQTADIISRSLRGTPVPVAENGLLPLDDPSIWGERLQSMDRDVLLAGHLPHLSRLASFLLFRDPGRDIIDFTPGAVLCLERTEEWRVKWMLSPQVIKGR